MTFQNEWSSLISLLEVRLKLTYGLNTNTGVRSRKKMDYVYKKKRGRDNIA